MAAKRKTEEVEKKYHVVTMNLYTSPHAERLLNISFRTSEWFYNAVLRESINRYKKYKSHHDFKNAVNLYPVIEQLEKDKKDKTKTKQEIDIIVDKIKDKKKEQNEFFQSAKKDSGFFFRSNTTLGKNSIEVFGYDVVRNNWDMKEYLPVSVANTLSARAFRAVENKSKKKKKKNNFYSRRNYNSSLPDKSAESICYQNGHVLYLNRKNKKIHLNLPIINYETDQKFQPILNETAKIARTSIVKKQVGNKWLYSIQLTCEGYPAQTHRYSLGKGKVCTDVGISDVAIASKNGCFLLKHFVDDVPEYKKYLKARRRLEREIDRQRRSNNPEKFNENGTIKKGVKGKFKVSERQKKNYIKLKELYRIEAERRKLFYEERVNFIRSLGDHLLLEDLCYKAWQRNKRYSRAVGRNAPGLFITMLINKFISTGGKVTKLNTYKTCLSQICPKCGDKKKKDLSEDVHSCKVCGYKMQRDLTSALCGLAVDENQLFHADVAQKLCRELEPLMQTAWKSN